MGNRTYTEEFKLKIVTEYLRDKKTNELLRRYELNKSQLYHWVKQYKEFGCFPDGRGKKSTGRPRVTKTNTSKMTKDEYIAYLEMELDILKYAAFLEKKSQA